MTDLTIDNLRPEALATGLKPCDRVDWRLFGLSLAGYNVIASALLSADCLAALALIGRKPVHDRNNAAHRPSAG